MYQHLASLAKYKSSRDCPCCCRSQFKTRIHGALFERVNRTDVVNQHAWCKANTRLEHDQFKLCAVYSFGHSSWKTRVPFNPSLLRLLSGMDISEETTLANTCSGIWNHANWRKCLCNWCNHTQQLQISRLRVTIAGLFTNNYPQGKVCQLV